MYKNRIILISIVSVLTVVVLIILFNPFESRKSKLYKIKLQMIHIMYDYIMERRPFPDFVRNDDILYKFWSKERNYVNGYGSKLSSAELISHACYMRDLVIDVFATFPDEEISYESFVFLVETVYVPVLDKELYDPKKYD